MEVMKARDHHIQCQHSNCIHIVCTACLSCKCQILWWCISARTSISSLPMRTAIPKSIILISESECGSRSIHIRYCENQCHHAANHVHVCEPIQCIHWSILNRCVRAESIPLLW